MFRRKSTLFPFLVSACAVFPLLTACKQTDSRVSWTYEPTRKSIWSANGFATSPVVAGDTLVYISGYPWHREVYCHAVDRRTGKEIWSSEFPVQQFVVKDDIVFLVSLPKFTEQVPGQSRKGKLYAMTVSKGEKLWDLDTVTNSKDVTILGVGQWLYCLTNDQTVSGVDPKTGMVKWQQQGPDFSTTDPSEPTKSTPKTSSSVVSHDDRIFVEYPDRSIVEYDGISGSIRERAKLPHYLTESTRTMFLDGNDLLIVDANGYVVTGDFTKKYTRGPIRTGAITSSVLLSDGKAYFGSTVSPKTLEQLDEKERQPVFKEEKKPKTIKVPKRDPSIPPTVIDIIEPERPQAVAASNLAKRPFVRALDVKTGKYIWESEMDAVVKGMPLLYDGKLFIATEQKSGVGAFFAFDAATGKRLWKVDSSVPVIGFTASDHVLYVNVGNSLKAVSVENGSDIFQFKIEKYFMAEQPVVIGDLVFVAAEDSNLYALSTSPSKPN